MTYKFANPDIQDDYEERAAIIEFDAKTPRIAAEKLAYLEIVEKYEGKIL